MSSTDSPPSSTISSPEPDSGPYLPPLDILIVGAGFGGIYQLHRFRQLGYTVQIFDSGSDLGGIWYWNAYPGARVDSEVPNYELSLPELYEDWNWEEKYPGREELRRYFEHVERKLGVKKDVRFGTRVVGAKWDEAEHEWVVEARQRMGEKGMEETVFVRTRFVVMCTGFAAKPYVPEFKGLDEFKGICYHTSRWPQSGLDLSGKKVGVVGTGASGVQIVQELGSVVEQLTVFQRTPNMALPMRQAKIDESSEMNNKKGRKEMYVQRRTTVGGFAYDRHDRSSSEVTPSDRLSHLEHLWSRGGLRFLHQNFTDLRSNQPLNDEVYAFWRDKVRERVRIRKDDDDRYSTWLKEKLAPTLPPHPIGVKRASLEQNYYDMFNLPQVKLVSIAETDTPIVEFTSKGILTRDGVEHEFDAIVLATGFDSLTGGITQVDFVGTDLPDEKRTIREKWKDGVKTYLGMTTAGFPNLFFVYGPQAPTAFCNGPTCGELQGDWIISCITHLSSHNLTRIEPLLSAELEWRQRVLDLSSLGLWSKARSWYMGSNIPGKKIEPLNWAGGVGMYVEICREKAEKGYEGFTLSGKEKEKEGVNGTATKT